jgi:uncharacterized protein (DUF427 family)
VVREKPHRNRSLESQIRRDVLKEKVVKAIWNGHVIAEATNTVVVEGNHYFPLESVKKEYLQSSSHTSVCPWKGVANYYTLTVDGKTNEDAVWYYGEPKSAAQEIKGRVAFWKGVNILP